MATASVLPKNKSRQRDDDRRQNVRRRADAVRGAVSIVDVARRYVPNLTPAGRELRGCSPFKAERTPSFFIDPSKNLFKCFSSGEGGDVIKLVMLCEGLSFTQALAQLVEGAGLVDDEAQKRAVRRYQARAAEAQAKEIYEARLKRDRAAEIWNRTLQADATPVEAYLQHRKIDLDALYSAYGRRIPKIIRYAPDLKYRARGHDGKWVRHRGPAMVAAVLDSQGCVVGVHRTWLAHDGIGKADVPSPKLTLGQIWGGAVYLSPFSAGCVVGEGIETTLSVIAALAADSQCVFGICGVSLGNLAGAGIGQGRWHPERPGQRLPSRILNRERPGLLPMRGIQQVTLLADADSKDADSYEELLGRAVGKFQMYGARVSIARPWAGSDFNDMVQASAPGETHDRVRNAEVCT